MTGLQKELLTVAYNVKGVSNSFAGGVVPPTNATLVPPGFGVQYMITACLLLRQKGSRKQPKVQKLSYGYS